MKSTGMRRSKVCVAVLIGAIVALTATAATPSRETAAAAAIGASTARSGGSPGEAHPGMAPSAVTPSSSEYPDSLWMLSTGKGNYLDNAYVGVCQDPMANAFAGECFDAYESPPQYTFDYGGSFPLATDGVNVFFNYEDTAVVGSSYPAMSCPIVDFLSSLDNCTPIQVGWKGFQPSTVAANYDTADDWGWMWLGWYVSDDSGGYIYLCPSNLPYSGATSMPDACTLLDDAGNRWVQQIVYANDSLYVALGNTGGNGMIWKCDPYTPGRCVTLDTLDDNGNRPLSLALGGGYLWAGMFNGEIYRCDPVIANTCVVWDTAGNEVESLADDGQGTLYASVRNSVFWSCPEATANRCSTVLDVDAWQVTAGAGLGFATFYFHDGYTAAASTGGYIPDTGGWNNEGGSLSILYIPAGGPQNPGAIQASLVLPPVLEQQCANGESLPAMVTVSGPYKLQLERDIDLCATRNAGDQSLLFGALNWGDYRITVPVAGYVFTGTATVSGATTKVTLVQSGRRPEPKFTG